MHDGMLDFCSKKHTGLFATKPVTLNLTRQYRGVNVFWQCYAKFNPVKGIEAELVEYATSIRSKIGNKKRYFGIKSGEMLAAPVDGVFLFGVVFDFSLPFH